MTLAAGVSAGVTPADAAPAANAQSQIMAGYEVSGAAARLVSTKVVLPDVTCPSTGNPGGLLFASLSRTGFAGRSPDKGPPARDALAGVSMSCQSGSLSYTPFFVIDNQVDPAEVLALSPGDTVQLTARQTAAGARVTVKNLTTKLSASIAGAGASSSGRDTAADIGVFDPTPVAPPPFGTVHFTANEVNGAALSGLSPVAYDWTDGTSVAMQTGPYDPTHNRFALTRVAG